VTVPSPENKQLDCKIALVYSTRVDAKADAKTEEGKEANRA